MRGTVTDRERIALTFTVRQGRSEQSADQPGSLLGSAGVPVVLRESRD